MSKSNIDSEEQINKEEAIPEEFVKVIYDLINDILFTFPEYKQSLNIDLHNIKERHILEQKIIVVELGEVSAFPKKGLTAGIQLGIRGLVECK